VTLVKNSAVSASSAAAPLPVHEQVYQMLRDRVLFGDLAPGEAVTIHGLAQSLPAGMTPVREAIRRLTSDGALRFLGNRRVIVPQLTLSDLEQLVFLRKSIEPELTRRAVIARPAGLVTELMAIDADLDQAIARGDVAAYLAQNYRFHAAIYACAEAPVLAETAEGLWLRFGPALRVVCGRFGTQNLPDRHKDLLAALSQGDAAGAATAMVQDIEQGMEQIAAVLADSA
jgi:DNA-binding GntR family transcriptional regulator